MTAYNPPEGPSTLQGPSSATPALLLRNSAASARRAMGAIAKTSGIAQFGDLALSSTGADKLITIAAGTVCIKGTQATDQGVYVGYNSPALAIDFLTAHPADATNPRIDGIDAIVQDTFYGGATDTWALVQTVGVPGASPVAPAVPANGFRLGTVQINANVVVTPTLASGLLIDLRTVAYFGAGGPWKFYRNLLAVAVASPVTIPIPAPPPGSGLDDLCISLKVRSSVAAIGDSIYLHFNGDVGANYWFQQVQSTGAGLTAAEGLGLVGDYMFELVGNTAPANYFGEGDIRIKDSAGVQKKSAIAVSFAPQGTTTGLLKLMVRGIQWNNVAPITSVGLALVTGPNFMVGSLISARYE